MRIINNIELFTWNDKKHGLADNCLVTNQIVRLWFPKAKCFYFIHKHYSFNICYYAWIILHIVESYFIIAVQYFDRLLKFLLFVDQVFDSADLHQF